MQQSYSRTQNPIQISFKSSSSSSSRLSLSPRGQDGLYRAPYGVIPRRNGGGKKGKGKEKEVQYDRLGGPTVRVLPASSPEKGGNLGDRFAAPPRHTAMASPPSTSRSLLCYGSLSPPTSECDGESFCDCDLADSSDISDPNCLSTTTDRSEFGSRFDIATSSSTSSLDSLPSLSSSQSPSRIPLFDDDSGTEDEDDDFLVTPPREPMLYRSSPSSAAARKIAKPTIATTDPLLSPPDSHSHLVVPLDFGHSSGHLATLRADRDGPTSRSPRAAASSHTTQTKGEESLLTKSLRSLTRLPNLSLPSLPVLPSLRIPSVTSLDIEGFGSVEESPPWEWRGSRSSVVRNYNSSNSSLSRRRTSVSTAEREGEGSTLRRALAEEAEHPESFDMTVQLQTFASSPSPPSSPRRKSIALPPPPPPSLPVTPTAPVEVAPVHPRIISNQRHLLMLSLEIAMMRSGKINCPLRPRAAVLRPPSERRANQSALRWEVRKSVSV